jgi:hypothetical protein
MIAPDSRGWYSFERDIDRDAARQLEEISSIEKLSLTKIPLVTVRQVRRLAKLRIEQLWLRCTVTRRAMRYVIQIPGLRILDVLAISGPGSLGNFHRAHDLEILRANHYMTEADLLEVARCPRLQVLGAQNSALTRRSMDAILALPCLSSLDLEGSCFDDGMAKRTSRSKTIASLDLGGTRITRNGLAYIVEMEQLKSLDLWATRLDKADLRQLLNLPNLESLSLGNYYGVPQMDGEKITQLILDSPNLKSVWLDGIRLEETQKQTLETRLDTLKVSH